ncbi:MAG: hypothetical protein AVDCRST_MAG28-1354 [uncultured Rubrobacteraceae bacterium]|uniref:Uncharacterized protein n=1 Tax=uncultured Rubrobacteraceae bacterium TaxID=349277 RepID=A0A6J4QNX8_9ACTN|nr:MAG: hypothetical protein AVDCRST_MAG28-1354 [uncultured Rubrobacteraceae bacterium]
MGALALCILFASSPSAFFRDLLVYSSIIRHQTKPGFTLTTLLISPATVLLTFNFNPPET